MDKKKVKELIENAIYQLDPFSMDNSNYADLCKNATKILEDALKELSKSDWISVEDRLPEYNKEVLVTDKEGYVLIDYRSDPRREYNDGNGFVESFHVTHWKPIEKLEE